MHLTLDIALAAVCSMRCTQRYAIDKPNSDRDLCSPGDAEHARVNADRHVYVVLGALVDIVDQLSGNISAWHTDDAVSLYL